MEIRVKERERYQEIFHPLFDSSRQQQQSALNRLKARIESFIWVSSMGGRGPNPWAIFSCFPQAISKEVDWKWNRQSMNELEPNGMPVSQTVFSCHITRFCISYLSNNTRGSWVKNTTHYFCNFF